MLTINKQQTKKFFTIIPPVRMITLKKIEAVRLNLNHLWCSSIGKDEISQDFHNKRLFGPKFELR